MFLSFVQSDGYNPLQVATTNFKISNDKVDSLLSTLGIIEKYDVTSSGVTVPLGATDIMRSLLTKPFRVGQLFHDMKANGVESNIEKNEFLRRIMITSDQASAAAYMQNGYWCDVSALMILLSYIHCFETPYHLQSI